MAAVLAIAGCSTVTFDRYGKVVEDAKTIRPDGEPVQIPANAPSISQGFAPERRNIENEDTVGPHEGIDIIEKAGHPVIAPVSGTVVQSMFEPMYGNRLVLDHGQSKDGQFFRTWYFHLQERLVEKGDRLVRGQLIGKLGRTGLLAGGLAHLHFETRIASSQDQFHYYPINPHRLWFDGIGVVTCFDKNRSYAAFPLKTTYPVPCQGIDWK